MLGDNKHDVSDILKKEKEKRKSVWRCSRYRLHRCDFMVIWALHGTQKTIVVTRGSLRPAEGVSLDLSLKHEVISSR